MQRYKGNQQTAALLHYLGLPADAADAYGSTPLHLAASRNAPHVIEYLIDESSTDTEKLVALKDNKVTQGLLLLLLPSSPLVRHATLCCAPPNSTYLVVRAAPRLRLRRGAAMPSQCGCSSAPLRRCAHGS